MTANRDLILAGMNGGGAAGTALAMFADAPATMPTAAVGAGATLDAGFKDPGWVTEDGLTRSVDLQTNEVPAYGSQVPVRVIKTSRTVTFNIGFLESNPVSLAIYHELPLSGAGALTPDATGAFDFTEGTPRTQLYSAVFDIVDGANHVRAVVPKLEVTGQEDFSATPGNPLTYSVTLTAYPGSDGVAIHWFYVLDALATP
jgi:hypothetical protein